MSNPAGSRPLKRPAILLLGPTGSGKTPLGDLIAERGLWKRRCVHFDFGENLRRIMKRNRPDDLISRENLKFLRHVLDSGALLENEHFAVAERILQSFLASHRADARGVVVLNGLPRHVGQAKAIDSILVVEAVVYLSCSPETVLARIRANAGGDRTGRQDDDRRAIQDKLRVFRERTAPLVDHYRSRGARVETVEVTLATTAGDAWKRLDEAQGPETTTGGENDCKPGRPLLD